MPVRERGIKTLIWLMALNRPVTSLHGRFLIFRKRVVYDLHITPQVCSMEKALNDRWDIVQRRIFITRGVERNPVVLFRKVELKKLPLFRKTEAQPQVLWAKAETANYGVDYIINIPLFLPFDIDELNAFVEVINPTKTQRVNLF
jgi:hypothetical protein